MVYRLVCGSFHAPVMGVIWFVKIKMGSISDKMAGYIVLLVDIFKIKSIAIHFSVNEGYCSLLTEKALPR